MPICSKTEATLRPRRERNLRRRRERNVKGNRAQGNLFCVRESPRGSVIAAGAAAIVGGKIAHSTVSEQLAQERIDMPCQGGVEALKDKESQEALRPCVGQRLTTGPERRPLPTIASASPCSRPPAERLRRRRIRPAESDGAECRKDHRRRTWKTRRRPICCRSPRKRPSSSGGIGRRARFRSVCPKGRGGSTPPLSTDMCIHNTT